MHSLISLNVSAHVYVSSDLLSLSVVIQTQFRILCVKYLPTVQVQVCLSDLVGGVCSGVMFVVCANVACGVLPATASLGCCLVCPVRSARVLSWVEGLTYMTYGVDCT